MREVLLSEVLPGTRQRIKQKIAHPESIIYYTKDDADNWYFSNGYYAPAFQANEYKHRLTDRGVIVERIYISPKDITTFNPHTL